LSIVDNMRMLSLADVGQEMEQTSFSDMAEQFRSGRSTPREALEQTIAKVEAREPHLHAFAFLDVDLCRAAADRSTERYRRGQPLSAFDGCPVGIKDIIETADMPTGCGNPAFTGTRTGRDAACVDALRLGGAIPFGKTVTTEFAIGFSGPTLNPHDPERTPGGSSSGSAAAVGAGLLPVALGTQTQGSVLRPASYTGCIGFKPTLGALPLGGVHPLSASHDHLGVFANHMDDLWGIASLISDYGSPGFAGLGGAAARAPAGQRPRRLVRLHLAAWDEVDDAHRAVVDDQIEDLAAQGIEIVDRRSDRAVQALEDALDRDVAASLDMVAWEMRFPFRGYVERHGERIGERIRTLLARAEELRPIDYDMALARQKAARSLVAETLARLDGDAFVLPAASGPAPKGLVNTGSRAHLVYWSWLGFPAISLPIMKADGMPWGLQLAGVAGGDARLCATARWVLENRAS
jgi:Asp-tRNA(Asn)/Glu-tRNA(Gln) amidotransferase A subunit family amidase